jgi:hypothetical protein
MGHFYTKMKKKTKQRKELKAKRRESKRIKLRQEEKTRRMLENAIKQKGTTIRKVQDGQ